ncbi:MAG: hypothetical protein H6744_18115 [Deltaproteobacteria bacterium]|nr:hypothetical protein [Deltaproteobacteria bacterium]MCB9788597.1 hypothetical protein [Deltaproteobacteria bacterium]
MADGAGRGMPLLVVEDVAALREFYKERLGFEEVTWKEAGEGGFVVFTYGTCKLGYTTPGALPELPGLTRNAVVVFELPELDQVHQLMASRAGDAVGEVRTVEWGRYFDVRDPAGTVARFIEVSAE